MKRMNVWDKYQLELWTVIDDYSQLPSYPNPRNDNEQLLQWQYEYLAEGKKSSMDKIWFKSLELANKFIKKEQSRKGFVLSSNDTYDKALDAVEYVLRRYSYNKKYCIMESFTCSVYFGVMHALWYRTMSQKALEEAVVVMNEHDFQYIEEALDFIKLQRLKKKLKREAKSLQLWFDF